MLWLWIILFRKWTEMNTVCIKTVSSVFLLAAIPIYSKQWITFCHVEFDSIQFCRRYVNTYSWTKYENAPLCHLRIGSWCRHAVLASNVPPAQSELSYKSKWAASEYGIVHKGKLFPCAERGRHYSNVVMEFIHFYSRRPILFVCLAIFSAV